MSANPIFSSWLLTFLVVGFSYIGFSGENLTRKVEKSIRGTSIRYIHPAPLEQSNAPTVTNVVNLPLIEQNAATSTPVPNENYPAPESEIETDPGTPTPTPIPVQSGSENLPIVIGAFAIIVVILLAWFFVGYLPSRNQ